MSMSVPSTRQISRTGLRVPVPKNADRTPPPRARCRRRVPAGRLMSVIQPVASRPAAATYRPGPAERARFVHRLQERAVPGLDVEDDPGRPRRELLGQDGRDDERDRLDRPRHVAQRVEDPVGRGDRVGLRKERGSDLRERLADARHIEVGSEARDRRQLVESAPGVAEPAARHHADARARRRDQWREDERHLVPHAARRVLVDHGREIREVPRLAGVAHGLGQRGGLRGREPEDHGRHEERGRLILGDLPGHDTLNQVGDLLARKLFAGALGPEDLVDRPHGFAFFPAGAVSVSRTFFRHRTAASRIAFSSSVVQRRFSSSLFPSTQTSVTSAVFAE